MPVSRWIDVGHAPRRTAAPADEAPAEPQAEPESQPPRPAPLRIRVEPRSNVIVLACVGVMDHSTSGELHGALKDLERTTLPRWVVDASCVTHISSGGFNVLISFVHRHRLAGGDLKLAALSGRVRTLVEAVGADRVLRIFPTVAEACEDFKRPLALYFRVDEDFVARKSRGPVHATTCAKVQGSRLNRLVTFASLADALNAGRRPCGACLGTSGTVGP